MDYPDSRLQFPLDCPCNARAPGVRVVLLNVQTALMMEKAVDDMGCLTGCRCDHLGMEGAVLIGDVGVEGDARFVAVMGVHIADGFAAAAGAVELPIGG